MLSVFGEVFVTAGRMGLVVGTDVCSACAGAGESVFAGNGSVFTVGVGSGFVVSGFAGASVRVGVVGVVPVRFGTTGLGLVLGTPGAPLSADCASGLVGVAGFCPVWLVPTGWAC